MQGRPFSSWGSHNIRGAETMIEEGDLKERIKRVQEGNERVVKVVEELKRAGIKTLKDEE